MTPDRLTAAARRALDSLNDLIRDHSDPGAEALGARFELEQALLAVQPPADRAAAPAAWIDGHPQLEAIAAAVWEQCEHHDSGLIIDDPRNIAVAALRASLSAPTDWAGVQHVVMGLRRMAGGQPTPAEARLTLRERHRAAWNALSPAVQAARLAALDAETLPPPEGPEYIPCACGHIEPEHREQRPGWTREACLKCDCVDYVPSTPRDLRVRVLREVLARIDGSRGDGDSPTEDVPAAQVRAVFQEMLADMQDGAESETEAHPPSRTWKVESPRRDIWASWGATYGDRDWALESYEFATTTAPARPFRLVRATTTYTVEAEHQPPTEEPRP